MTTKKVKIYKNNENSGWLGNNQNWWVDPNFKHSFEIFDIDYFYEENYFSKVKVDQKAVDNFVKMTPSWGL